MLKFYKKRTDSEGIETGDFYGFDPIILYEELKPLNARCDTAEVTISVFPIDPEGEFDEKVIREVVLKHGSEEQVAARVAAKEKAIFNAPILEALITIDTKRIRAMCEGDTEWLEKYNQQSKELRGRLI